MKWDPLSSGEGDMLLEDLAQAFDATNVVADKSSKSIDFTSVLDGLPTYGFRVDDIVGTELLIQHPAAKVIDAQMHSNEVSDVQTAVAASSDDSPQKIETISQIDMQVCEDDSKKEPTTIGFRENAIALRKCGTSHGQGILVQNQTAASFTPIRCTKSDAALDFSNTESTLEGGSISHSKGGHGIPQSPVNMRNTAFDEAPVDKNSKERATTTGHASDDKIYITEPGNHTSINDEKLVPEPEHHTCIADEMKIDCSSEANQDEYMEVTVEGQQHETGEGNINPPNLSSETTNLLRESGKSLSPEAVREDHEQVSRLESKETEVEEEVASLPYDNTFEIPMEGKKEHKIIHQVQYCRNNNDRESGKTQAKRSRVGLARLRLFKPFLLHSRFKRISRKGKHRGV